MAQQCLRQIVAVLCACTGLTGVAAAQWTVTYLGPSDTSSQALGVWAGGGGATQVGHVVAADGAPRAALWSGTASWVNLNPATSRESVAHAVKGTQQVGYAWLNDDVHPGGHHAGLWHGTAASWVDL